jgi:hypothetical protein
MGKIQIRDKHPGSATLPVGLSIREKKKVVAPGKIIQLRSHLYQMKSLFVSQILFETTAIYTGNFALHRYPSYDKQSIILNQLFVSIKVRKLGTVSTVPYQL